MKKAIFLYNTESGRGKVDKKVDQICKIFIDAGYNINPQPIDFDDNPFYGDNNIDTVIVAGGDGTLNYVVNCMKACNINIPIGVIAAGTANDFAKGLGISKNILKSAQQIASGTIKRIDCGRVNDQYFINILSFGVFTTTSQKTSDALKHRVGKLAYILEGAKEFFNIHSMPLKVTADGTYFEINSYMVMILNNVTAGGFHLARGASIEDGLFDCVILEKRNVIYSAVAMSLYLLGCKSKIIKHIRAKDIHISTPANEPTDIDGQKGSNFPLHIECLHRELQVIVPKGI